MVVPNTATTIVHAAFVAGTCGMKMPIAAARQSVFTTISNTKYASNGKVRNFITRT